MTGHKYIKITNYKTRPNLHCTMFVMPVTKYRRFKKSNVSNIQGDSKRWTQFRTSIFPELYMVCE